MAKFNQLEVKVRDQDTQVKMAKDEIIFLKTQIQRFESVLIENGRTKYRTADISQTASNKAITATTSAFFIPRTCNEARESGLPEFKESGMYWIDPDGPGIGEGAINVYCDMATGDFGDVEMTDKFLISNTAGFPMHRCY